MTGPLDNVRVVEGNLDATSLRFAIVVSRFNNFITERLAEGAVDTLLRLGAAAGDIMVARVPGSWELPQAAARIIAQGDHDAVIALGCLMRGDTIHFDLIAGQVTKELSALGQGPVPVIFGVLTTDNLEQSIHRAGAKYGNKGAEAAQSAVEQARLYKALEPRSSATTKTAKASRPSRRKR